MSNTTVHHGAVVMSLTDAPVSGKLASDKQASRKTTATKKAPNSQKLGKRASTIAHKIGRVALFALLVVLLLIFIAPFLLVIVNVFKKKGDINSSPLSLIGKHGFILDNFPDAMKKMNFWTVFTNSLIITVSATLLTVAVSAMAAYVIVRNPRWKINTLFFAALVASMVIPFQVLMVPLVSIYGGLLNVLNSRITLILMHVGFSVSLAIFMFHGAIKTNVPLELEEAANIDGCSKWRTFWRIVFPLLKPTVATIAIIDAMGYWNDYLLPSLVLGRKELYTIPVATKVFYGTYSNDIGLIMAALLLAMLPILILYLLLQRYVVEGVTAGAVKG